MARDVLDGPEDGREAGEEGAGGQVGGDGARAWLVRQRGGDTPDGLNPDAQDHHQVGRAPQAGLQVRTEEVMPEIVRPETEDLPHHADEEEPASTQRMAVGGGGRSPHAPRGEHADDEEAGEDQGVGRAEGRLPADIAVPREVPEEPHRLEDDPDAPHQSTWRRSVTGGNPQSENQALPSST